MYYIAGSMHNINYCPDKGGVLINFRVSFTLCYWDHASFKGGVLISGMACTLLYVSVVVHIVPKVFSIQRYFFIFSCRLNDELFLYSRLWCIYFSGCITFGTIGRRLAASDSIGLGTT